MSTAEVEAAIRDACVRIRRAWVREDAPLSRERRERTPGPSVPLDGAWIIRRTVVEELAYWAHAALDDGALSNPPSPIALGDPLATSGALLADARRLSGWAYGERCAYDLGRVAERIEGLTRDEPPAVLLGPCPVEVVGPDDERTPCGADVRADLDHASDVVCPRCGTVDTVEGWRRRMAADLGHVTAEELARHLRRIGVRTTARGLQQRAHRGTIPAPIGRDDAGRSLWDAEAVMRAFIARE